MRFPGSNCYRPQGSLDVMRSSQTGKRLGLLLRLQVETQRLITRWVGRHFSTNVQNPQRAGAVQPINGIKIANEHSDDRR